MYKFEKECLGTKLILSNGERSFETHDIEKIGSLIENFEATYSRFIAGNFLDTLNTTKKALAPGELLSMIQLGKKISKITQGYFDITVLPKLENIGYGIQKQKQIENMGYQNIEIQGNQIILHNNVSIELGAIGKGYLIDVIYTILDKHYSEFIINFGGDIRIKGKQTFELEDPLSDTISIGNINIENMALASSNPRKRATKKGHHLINPYNDTDTDQKLTVFTTHKLAIFADSFATALWVCPLDLSLKILGDVSGLEGMIVSEDGKIYTSQGFDATFYKQ